MPEGQRQSHLHEKFESFLSQGFEDRIFVYDVSATEAYCEIVITREKAGYPIDAFDAMILAIAKVNGSGIATRDAADFGGYGVEIINPW